MKKTFAWLERNKIAYDFHDYKKSGADLAILKKAIDQQGWQEVINRKGTTWRALPAEIQNSMDDRLALQTAQKNPATIRRPLIVVDDKIFIGFDESVMKELFS